MKFIKLAFLAVLAGVFFTACAAPRFYVDQEWKGQSQPESVKVIFTKPVVGNPDDLKDDLPEFENNFVKWFGPQAKEYFIAEGRNKVKFSMKQVPAEEIKPQKVKLGNDDFDAPAFAATDVETTVYVVMTDIWLGRESETYMTAQGNAASMAGDPMGTGYSTSNYFVSKCKYAFYDTKTGKLLAYGHAEGKAQYQFAVTKSDWEFALRDMVGKVLTNTPVVSW